MVETKQALTDRETGIGAQLREGPCGGRLGPCGGGRGDESGLSTKCVLLMNVSSLCG